MNTDELKLITKDQIPVLSKTLTADNIIFLVKTLSENDDKLRYNAFLLLQSNSQQFPFVYEYWDELEKKLESENSYQRNIGIKLIAENVRWDKGGKFRETINKYLACCTDEKFITARQTIQGLASILKATKKHDEKIRQKLTNLSLEQYKKSQQKLLTKDISTILKILDNR